MNSHLSTTCVGATCARMGWNSRHILTPSHITNTFPLKRKINTKFEPCYTKFTWLSTRKSSKSSKESLLKSHPGITSNERTNEPTEWVLHLILSSVSAWGIWFTTGTNMTVSLLDIWSRCFVTYIKKWYIPYKEYSYTDIAI